MSKTVKFANNMKCSACNKQINGGHYSTPRGIYCCECWESKVPKSRRWLMEAEAMMDMMMKASGQ